MNTLDDLHIVTGAEKLLLVCQFPTKWFSLHSVVWTANLEYDTVLGIKLSCFLGWLCEAPCRVWLEHRCTRRKVWTVCNTSCSFCRPCQCPPMVTWEWCFSAESGKYIYVGNNNIVLVYTVYLSPIWNRGAGMVQWWEHLPLTNMTQVRFPDLESYMGWDFCWFSSLVNEALEPWLTHSCRSLSWFL